MPASGRNSRKSEENEKKKKECERGVPVLAVLFAVLLSAAVSD